MQPFSEPIHVTRPIQPPIEAYFAKLEEVWKTKQFTNNGPIATRLEAKLGGVLGNCISLASSGTAALTLALQALQVKGQVLTTPFSFPATAHAIKAAGCEPVFADVNPVTMCLDPEIVRKMLLSINSCAAIMPVHVFGIPCDVKAFRAISDEYKIPVIYDAAHAFGVEIEGKPIASWGTASAFSFHATKLFHTVEGGAAVTCSPALKARVDILRNHGFDGTEFRLQGINAKMSEVHAAMGECVLPMVAEERKKRAEILSEYFRHVMDGIEMPMVHAVVDGMSLQYFPIRVKDGRRDFLFDELKKLNVHPRKYFWPLVSDTPAYAGYYGEFPCARRASEEILCLPFYGELGVENATRIAQMIRHILEK